MLQACLNGARLPGAHPRLPTTPDALAADASACRLAGATDIHCHPRDADGMQSLDPALVGDALAAIRTACPGMPVGISTVLSICGDHRRTVAAIGQFEICPDHASVNLSEPGACEIMAALEERGIGIDAGLASCDDAARLIALSHPPALHRILIEIDLTDFDNARIESEAILCLTGDRFSMPVLLHGEQEPIVWPMVALAARSGYETRIGFEDGFHLPDGTIAPDNAALVAMARAVVAGKARG